MAKGTVFVTGSSGRIGRLLRLLWAEEAFDGRSLRFLTRSDWALPGGAAPSLGPLDLVIDLAGQIKGEVAANPAMSAAVATAVARAGASLFYMSSAAVYAGGPHPMKETDPPKPAGAYGCSKRDAEVEIRKSGAAAVILRLANLAGADSLLGGNPTDRPVLLDPVSGQAGGPVRSYVGPETLAAVLRGLVMRHLVKGDLPAVINLAQPGPVSMADLLTAKGTSWLFGPPRDGVLARMELDTELLQSLVPVGPATAQSLLAELSCLRSWP